MKKGKIYPPKLAEALLQKILSKSIAYSVLGDFEEIFYGLLDKRGYVLASIWYWWQVLKSFPAFIKDKIFWGGVMLGNYIKIALRNFFSHKVYTSINLFGLVLGLSCSLLIIFYVQYETSYDEHLSNVEQKFRIIKANREINGKNKTRWMPAPLGKIIKDEIPEVVKSARLDIAESRVKFGNNVFLEKNFGFVDKDFLDLFNVELIGSEKNNPLANLNSLLISESAADKFFGRENPVGKTLIQEGNQEFIVSGIFKDFPKNMHFHLDFIANYNILYSDPNEAGWLNDWRFTDPAIYLEIQKNADPQIVASKIEGLYLSNIAEGSEVNLFLENMADIHTNTKVFWELENPADPKYLYMFLSVAVIILLIASFNYMSITTARATVREKEIGIRKVIGAGRKRIALQFLAEAFLFTAIGLIIALGVTTFLLPQFSNLIGQEISYNIFQPNTILVLLSILIVISLVSGSYPAFLISSFEPMSIFKNISSIGKSRSVVLRSVLVVFQFSISAFLIICTIFVQQQREFISDRDLGFDKEQVLCLKYMVDENSDLNSLKNEFLKHPAVKNAVISASLPIEINQLGPVSDWEGKTEEDQLRISRIFVDYNFVEFFGIKIKQGRNFSEDFVTDKTSAYIINESAVKKIGWDNAVGKSFENGKVIGVIEDYHFQPLHLEIQPIVIELMNNAVEDHTSRAYISVKVNDLQNPKLLEELEEISRRVEPSQPFLYSFLNEKVEHQYLTESRLGKLFNYFTIVAILIATLGLIGLTMFVTEQKTKEIGIRKVLGAGQFSIVNILLGKFSKWILLSIIIAVPASYYFISLWLSDFAYKIDITAGPFIYAIFFLLLFTFFAVGLQVVKAARKNPVESLKYE